MEAVHLADGDGGKAGGDAALADLGEDRILGREGLLRPPRQVGIGGSKRLVRGRGGHRFSAHSAPARCRFFAARCRLASIRFCFDARVGLVGRRGGGR